MLKFKRTKPFLLATAGSTVDGRTIDDKMLDEMASSYDPKTYGARLNIEHIRGITGEKPFRSYGDVVEVSVGEVEVNFNGAKEKRKALYGTFDVLEDAEQLNASGQKVYPSIEIEPNFGGKGFAYLMGCALTDSPASIATERLQFKVARPGALNLNGETALALEFADDKGDPTAEGNSFLTSLTGVLDKFAAKFTPAKPEDKPEPKPLETPQGFSVDTFKDMFGEFGKTINDAIVTQGNSFRQEVDALTVSVKKLSADIETTPAPGQQARPPANGGNFVKTDC